MSFKKEFQIGLQQLMRLRGEKNTPLSIKAGLSSTAIRDIYKRDAAPRVDTAMAIADALGVGLDDIFKAARGVFPESKGSDYNHICYIPYYDTKLSAGDGYYNPNNPEILDAIPFTSDFLNRKLHRRTSDNLICCKASGDSMSPVIEDGDLLILDTKFPEKIAGIYGVNYGDEPLVKRVEKTSATAYSLISENTRYAPTIITTNDPEPFNIIGRVIWIARMI